MAFKLQPQHLAAGWLGARPVTRGQRPREPLRPSQAWAWGAALLSPGLGCCGLQGKAESTGPGQHQCPWHRRSGLKVGSVLGSALSSPPRCPEDRGVQVGGATCAVPSSHAAALPGQESGLTVGTLCPNLLAAQSSQGRLHELLALRPAPTAREEVGGAEGAGPSQGRGPHSVCQTAAAAGSASTWVRKARRPAPCPPSWPAPTPAVVTCPHTHHRDLPHARHRPRQRRQRRAACRSCSRKIGHGRPL